MDLSTIIGLISGVALISGAIILGGDVGGFIEFQAVLIVFGGTFAATLASFPMDRFKALAKIIRTAFKKTSMEASETIALLVQLAEKARREGLLALEDDVAEIDDDFMEKGIQLVVDGTDPELTRSILETELSFVEERHKDGQGMFQTMGAFSPAFGMAGTLIGLIRMLGDLDDPDAIGPGMAIALVTTLYGVLAANLIFFPVANKLKAKSGEEILLKEVMLEGILSIQAGENPRIVEEKLKAFLAPQSREAVEEGKEEEVEVDTGG